MSKERAERVGYATVNKQKKEKGETKNSKSKK
jgi:hypothetical protein